MEKLTKESNIEEYIVKLDNYKIKSTPVGKGSFGIIFLAKDSNGETFAVKRIKRSDIKGFYENQHIKEELKLYISLNNEHIIKLKDIKFTETDLYIFLEYCDCETLASFLKNYFSIFHHSPSANILQIIGKGIVEGLSYMSAVGCIHRDLKLENIMLSMKSSSCVNLKPIDTLVKDNISSLVNNPDEYISPTEKEICSKNIFDNIAPFPEYYKKEYKQNESAFNKLINEQCIIKIIDLGLGKNINQLGTTSSVCGSPIMMAPEILAVLFNDGINYNGKVDIWSLGCTLFLFAFGYFPFIGIDEKDLYKNLQKGEYYIEKTNELTEEFLDLITGLLRFDYKKRYDWNTILSHPFFEKDVGSFKKFEWNGMSKLKLNSHEEKNLLKFEVKDKMGNYTKNKAPAKVNPLEEKFNDLFIFNLDNCSVIEYKMKEKCIEDNWYLLEMEMNKKISSDKKKKGKKEQYCKLI